MFKETTAEDKVAQEVLTALAEADEFDEGDEGFFDDILESGAVDKDHVMWGEEHVPEDEVPAMFKSLPFEKYDMGDLYSDEDDEDDEDDDSPVAGPVIRGRADPDQEYHLDKLLADYDDEELGELDEDQAIGLQDIDTYDDVLDDYISKQIDWATGIAQARDEEVREAEEAGLSSLHAHLGIGSEFSGEAESETDGEEELEVRVVKRGEQWDCESVLSMRSNLSNHPGKIDRISIRRPKRVKPILEDLEDLPEEDAVILPELRNERPKDETAEERRERKKAVKERARICRELKKQNKGVWQRETAKLMGRSVNKGFDVPQGIRVVPI